MAGLSRPSTSLLAEYKDVDARHKAGHDEILSAQRLQIDLPIIKLRQQCQHGLRALFVPTAMANVACKFFLDVGPRERLVGAAAEMRLTLLDDTPVVEHRADVSGEIVRIRIVRIDRVAHF